MFVALRGALLTVVAVLVQGGGHLTRLEHVLYDRRVAYCQFSAPPPSNNFIHLDIDDNALAHVGRWPWPRSQMAEIVDELRLAEPKVLVLDILFAEPGGTADDGSGATVDQDQVLAGAFRRFGPCLVPVSLSFEDVGPKGELQRHLLGLLVDNPERSPVECQKLLEAQGFRIATLATQVNQAFLSLRPQALYERIWRELSADGALDEPELRKRLLPHVNSETRSVLEKLLDEQYERVLRERQLLRFTLPMQPGLPPILRASDQVTPVVPLGQAAGFSGFVDYLPDRVEGTVRSVPLAVVYRGRIIPHMSLVAACAMLDADIHDLRFTADSVTIPRRQGRDIVIPVSTRQTTTAGDVGLLMQVPLFGREGEWLTMYDYPRHQANAQHVSLYEVWQICLTSRSIRNNQTLADQALIKMLKLTDPNTAASYAAAPLHDQAKIDFIRSTRDNVSKIIEGLAAVPEAGPDVRLLLQNLKASDEVLRQFLTQNEALEQQLKKLRADLRQKLKGRALFLGGTGTGQLDVYPTSLFFSCPGIVIHGAIFNAIMTGKMWTVAKPKINLLITAMLGLLTVVLVSLLSPLPAFLASVLLGGGYLAINGLVLFDHNNLIVDAAGPLVAIGLVWSGLTLTNFIIEVRERARITRRFRCYVDPSLVNWVLDHPRQARFDGEAREMTVAFSDLAGFTPLLDEIGEQAVPVLAEYMGRMVPIIRAQQGYVAQLLGDGIFFFFGAPEPDTDHATHAVAAILSMHAALEEFNVQLRGRGLLPLGMRAGVGSGRVIIGDAGPPEASAYTALGATTNLAARLESANKLFGTRTLVTDRTVELLNGAFLVRPVANLRAVGKKTGVQVYEPLCAMSAATPQLRCLVQHTTLVVKAYQSGAFKGCLTAAEQMQRDCGSSKLVDLYLGLSSNHLASSPAYFDGIIDQPEK